MSNGKDETNVNRAHELFASVGFFYSRAFAASVATPDGYGDGGPAELWHAARPFSSGCLHIILLLYLL